MRTAPEIKELGIAFGRALLLVLKQCAIYSAEHPSIQKPLDHAFSILSEILKSTGQQLVFGFLGGRVLINDIATMDTALRPLQRHFEQRGIAGIVMLPTITANGFKNLSAVIATPPRTVLSEGGPQHYFEQHQIAGARIIISPEHNESSDVFLNISGERLMANGNWAATLSEGRTLNLDAPTGALDEVLQAVAPSAGGRDSQASVESMIGSVLSDPRADATDLLRRVAELMQQQSEGAPGSAAQDPGEIARELVEDTAARWAVGSLSAVKSQAEMPLNYEGVIQSLSRALVTVLLLQNTLKKIARLSEEQHLDSSLIELVRHEIAFSSLSLYEQSQQLLTKERYSLAEFRQLIITIKALLQRGDVSAASALAEHFITVLAEEDVTPEELSRTADLFHLLRNVPQIGFFAALRPLLFSAITKFTGDEHHRQLVYLIGAEGSRALDAEDWDALLPVVDTLENNLTEDDSAHGSCCRAEIERLEQRAGLDEALEDLIAHRDYRSSGRQSVSLCRAFGPRAAEKLTQRLEIEEDASIRLRLVRVIGQSGESAVRVVRRRLADSRWYVVRNACVLLGDLKDPELLAQLAPALTHTDDRVQMSALQTLIRTNVPGREQVLSDSLAGMFPPVAEVALDELLLMREPASLAGIRDFLLNGGEGKSGLLIKALQVASVIESDEVRQVLASATANTQLPDAVRQSAEQALDDWDQKNGRG